MYTISISEHFIKIIVDHEYCLGADDLKLLKFNKAEFISILPIIKKVVDVTGKIIVSNTN